MKIVTAALVLLVLASGGPAAAQTAPNRALERFKTQAVSFSQHDGLGRANMDAVRASGAECVVVEHRDVAFVGAEPVDHLGAAWVGPDCSSSEGAVAITLFAGVVPQANGDDVIVDERAVDMITIYGAAPYDGLIREGLRALISPEPFRAGALPVWNVGALTPSLPTGLVFQAGVERELYETVRARNGGVWCYQRHQRSMTCFAHAPGRAAAIEILQLYGFGPYRTATASEAVDILLGRRPAMTMEQYRAIEEAEGAEIRRVVQRIMENTASPPEN